MKQKKTIEQARPNLEIQDAWTDSYDLSKGLGDLLHLAAGSRDGLSQEGAAALCVLTDRLSDKLTIINSFFRAPEDGAL
jgi:hypothetical protein